MNSFTKALSLPIAVLALCGAGEPIVIKMDNIPTYNIELLLNGVPTTCLVDTGANRYLHMTTATADAAGVDIASAVFDWKMYNGSGATDVALGSISTVQIGQCVDADVEAILRPSDQPHCLLGLRYLNDHYDVTMKKQRMSLTRTSKCNQPKE